MNKLTKCKNCKQIPEISKNDDGQYKYVLRHKAGSVCYPTYKLESYQNTKDDCIKDWNEFNK